MPSILFHELVGYKIAKEEKKYDTNEFFLGLIVPDSVNAYGFASKEDRWRTHVRDKNLEIWQKNIIKYYKENEEKYENTYLTGYLVHVLTDIICDKIYQNEIYPKLIEQGYDYNTAYSYYEQSIIKFEKSNINKKWWKEAKEKFQNGKIEPINQMEEKMIQDEVKYTIKKYEKYEYEKEEFITEEFADKVKTEVLRIVKNIRIIKFRKFIKNTNKKSIENSMLFTFGGDYRSRTDHQSFADSCLTAWLSRHIKLYVLNKQNITKFYLEQVTRIGLVTKPWQGLVLPLNYTCKILCLKNTLI